MTSMVSTINGTLYLIDGGVLHKSTNGLTFNTVDSFPGDADCIAITSNDVIYVGSRNFLYQSTDGITFNKIYDFGNFNVGKIVIAPNNIMYLIIGDGLNQHVTKSFDAGYHFMQIPNIDFVIDIVVDSNNSIYILGNSLYKSIDNGNNFIEIPHSKEMSLLTLFITSDNILYITSVHSLYKLNSDNIFTSIWNFSEVINTAAYSPDGIIWIGTDHGLFKLWFT